MPQIRCPGGFQWLTPWLPGFPAERQRHFMTLCCRQLNAGPSFLQNRVLNRKALKKAAIIGSILSWVGKLNIMAQVPDGLLPILLKAPGSVTLSTPCQPSAWPQVEDAARWGGGAETKANT